MRHQQILPEVFTFSGPTFVEPVMQARHQRQSAGVPFKKLPPVVDKAWHAPQRANEPQRIEAELAGEEPVGLDQESLEFHAISCFGVSRIMSADTSM